MKEKIEEQVLALLYRMGVHLSLAAFDLLSRVWPAGALAIFRYESGRRNTFVYSCAAGEPNAEEAAAPDLFDEVRTIIERAPSPMGHDEYAIYATRMGPLPGERNGVPSGQPSYLTPTLDRRPVIETIGLVGDRYHDWYKGRGRTDLEDLLRRADPTPAAPVTVLRVLCAGQGVARLGKAMRLI
jgi:hypothetical protein